MRENELPQTPYTEKQGQYLAFIHLYTKLNRQAPAQTDIQRYFEVTPPTVHSMIKQLERKGLLSRVPRTARSVRVLLPADQLPELR